MSSEQGSAEHEIVVSRRLAAAPERVWAAWTDPAQIVKWWGPHGFTTTIHELDVRPGGIWRHTMHGPDGTDYGNDVRFMEVVEPRRIVYAHAGGPDGGPHGGFVGTWTFEPDRDGTRLTMRLEFGSTEDRARAAGGGAVEGGHQTLERLSTVLNGTAGARDEAAADRGSPS